MKQIKDLKQDHLLEFGKRIKLLREELRMKQKEFASGIGISASFISQIEMGHKNPGYDFLYILMSKYHVSLDWLFYGTGEMFVKQEAKRSEEEERDDISSIDDMIWFLENSNLFNLNVMGFAARFFFENEEHIDKDLAKRRKKREKGLDRKKQGF